MVTILKNETVNESERLLSTICEKTFLKLWAYPSVFRDEGKSKSGDGKEICDFLVVFQKEIIIFSDKLIKFNKDKPTDVAWKRWEKRAITESVSQLHGAQKWIREQTSRVFLDKKCTIKFPFFIDADISTFNIHLVAIANGLPDGKRLKINSMGSPRKNFEVNFNTMKPFYHIFDTKAFEIISKEMDTVDDFISYLKSRELLFIKGTPFYSCNEEDLLSEFILKKDIINSVFSEKPISKKIPCNSYKRLIKASDYKNGKILDKDSYIWDSIIDMIATHIMDDSLLFDYEMSFDEQKMTIETMARYNRLDRRALGIKIISKHRDTPPQHISSFSSPMNEHGFVYVIFPYSQFNPLDVSYDDYIKIREKILYSYCIHYSECYNADVIGLIVDNHDLNLTKHTVKTTQIIFKKSVTTLYRKKQKTTEYETSIMDEMKKQFGILSSQRMNVYAELHHQFPNKL